MKTLILLGSPKPGGESAAMAKALMEALPGEAHTLSAYSLKVDPCQDCGFCRSRFGCPIQDSQGQVFEGIHWADIVVVASPVYFYSVPGPLKTVLDRCQPFWAARVLRREKPAPKRGAVLLAGGAPSHPGQFDGALQTIGGWFREIGAVNKGQVLFPGTDKSALNQRPDIAEQIGALAKILSE